MSAPHCRVSGVSSLNYGQSEAVALSDARYRVFQRVERALQAVAARRREPLPVWLLDDARLVVWDQVEGRRATVDRRDSDAESLIRDRVRLLVAGAWDGEAGRVFDECWDHIPTVRGGPEEPPPVPAPPEQWATVAFAVVLVAFVALLAWAVWPRGGTPHAARPDAGDAGVHDAASVAADSGPAATIYERYPEPRGFRVATDTLISWRDLGWGLLVLLASAAMFLVWRGRTQGAFRLGSQYLMPPTARGRAGFETMPELSGASGIAASQVGRLDVRRLVRTIARRAGAPPDELPRTRHIVEVLTSGLPPGNPLRDELRAVLAPLATLARLPSPLFFLGRDSDRRIPPGVGSVIDLRHPVVWWRRPLLVSGDAPPTFPADPVRIFAGEAKTAAELLTIDHDPAPLKPGGQGQQVKLAVEQRVGGLARALAMCGPLTLPDLEELRRLLPTGSTAAGGLIPAYELDYLYVADCVVHSDHGMELLDFEVARLLARPPRATRSEEHNASAWERYQEEWSAAVRRRAVWEQAIARWQTARLEQVRLSDAASRRLVEADASHSAASSSAARDLLPGGAASARTVDLVPDGLERPLPRRLLDFDELCFDFVARCPVVVSTDGTVTTGAVRNFAAGPNVRERNADPKHGLFAVVREDLHSPAYREIALRRLRRLPWWARRGLLDALALHVPGVTVPPVPRAAEWWDRIPFGLRRLGRAVWVPLARYPSLLLRYINGVSHPYVDLWSGTVVDPRSPILRLPLTTFGNLGGFVEDRGALHIGIPGPSTYGLATAAAVAAAAVLFGGAVVGVVANNLDARNPWIELTDATAAVRLDAAIDAPPAPDVREYDVPRDSAGDAWDSPSHRDSPMPCLIALDYSSAWSLSRPAEMRLRYWAIDGVERYQAEDLVPVEVDRRSARVEVSFPQDASALVFFDSIENPRDDRDGRNYVRGRLRLPANHECPARAEVMMQPPVQARVVPADGAGVPCPTCRCEVASAWPDHPIVLDNGSFRAFTDEPVQIFCRATVSGCQSTGCWEPAGGWSPGRSGVRECPFEEFRLGPVTAEVTVREWTIVEVREPGVGATATLTRDPDGATLRSGEAVPVGISVTAGAHAPCARSTSAPSTILCEALVSLTPPMPVAVRSATVDCSSAGMEVRVEGRLAGCGIPVPISDDGDVEVLAYLGGVVVFEGHMTVSPTACEPRVTVPNDRPLLVVAPDLPGLELWYVLNGERRRFASGDRVPIGAGTIVATAPGHFDVEMDVFVRADRDRTVRILSLPPRPRPRLMGLVCVPQVETVAGAGAEVANWFRACLDTDTIPAQCVGGTLDLAPSAAAGGGLEFAYDPSFGIQEPCATWLTDRLSSCTPYPSMVRTSCSFSVAEEPAPTGAMMP